MAAQDLYASNVECLRHLAQQIAGQLMTVPQSTGSFEGSMEWFRCILKAIGCLGVLWWLCCGEAIIDIMAVYILIL